MHGCNLLRDVFYSLDRLFASFCNEGVELEVEIKQDIQEQPALQKKLGSAPMWKFFVYSFIGAFIFFVPITLGGKNSIMLDHIVTFIQLHTAPVLPYYALLVIAAGAIYPFVSGIWKKSTVNLIFSLFKVLGLFVGTMLVFNVGPAWIFAPSMGPFLFDKLVIPVGLLVPIGAVFLSLLVGYGLLEFIGVLTQVIMRPIWKTPGRSAIDAVASFVGKLFDRSSHYKSSIQRREIQCERSGDYCHRFLDGFGDVYGHCCQNTRFDGNVEYVFLADTHCYVSCNRHHSPYLAII